MLTLQTYAYCVTIIWTKVKDIEGQAKVSKGRKRPEIVSRLPRLTDLCKTLLTLNGWFPLRSKSVHYHGNLINKSHKSRFTGL